MDAKTKARELFNKACNYCWYNQSTTNQWGVSSIRTVYRYNEAKKCAIGIVDEILFEIQNGIKMEWLEFRSDVPAYLSYWEEVKRDINKIMEDENNG